VSAAHERARAAVHEAVDALFDLLACDAPVDAAPAAPTTAGLPKAKHDHDGHDH
jgi:hypothetical protein